MPLAGERRPAIAGDSKKLAGLAPPLRPRGRIGKRAAPRAKGRIYREAQRKGAPRESAATWRGPATQSRVTVRVRACYNPLTPSGHATV